MKKILPLICFLLLTCSLTSFAQQHKSKFVTYTFSITGLKTQADADKLDKFMLERKGIVTSKTDLLKKTVEVKTETMIDYHAIMLVVKSQGYEAAEEHQSKFEN